MKPFEKQAKASEKEQASFAREVQKLEKKFTDLVSEYLKKKGDPNQLITIDSETMTLLHFACLYGNEEAATLLLQHKANINPITKHNNTPLLLAVRNKCTNIVSLLIAQGADLNVVGENTGWFSRKFSGKTALDLALDKRLKKPHIGEISMLLIKAGAKTAYDRDYLKTSMAYYYSVKSSVAAPLSVFERCKNDLGFAYEMVVGYKGGIAGIEKLIHKLKNAYGFMSKSPFVFSNAASSGSFMPVDAIVNDALNQSRSAMDAAAFMDSFSAMDAIFDRFSVLAKHPGPAILPSAPAREPEEVAPPPPAYTADAPAPSAPQKTKRSSQGIG